MNPKTFRPALAALALAALAPAAFAQATLYGVVDIYMAKEKSGSSGPKSMGDGGNQASRFGVRATEDLGGGLTAEAVIEHSVLADTGAVGSSASFWDRQSFVGINSAAMGRLRLGRQYTPSFISMFSADVYGVGAVYSPMILAVQAQGQTGLVPFAVRYDNMLGYQSPALGPFQVEAAYRFGEAATLSKSSGEGMDISGRYRQGPIFVMAAVQENRSGSSAAPVASPTRSRHTQLGGSYQMGDLLLYLNLMRSTSNAAGANSSKLTNLGVRYNMGQWSLLAGHVSRNVSNTANDNTAFTLGVDYALSKSTTLYARSLHLTNKAAASVSLARVPVVANSGNDVSSTGVGITTRF